MANEPEERRSLPLPLIVVFLVAALAGAGYMGYRSFGPPTPAPMDAKGQENQKVIQDMVTKSNGNFGQLSPEDQKTLNDMTGGKGGLAYMATANEMKSSGKLK